MDAVTVTRWRRYGKDRLYVTGADGTRIGWYDLVTRTATVERPDQRAAFDAAVQRELAGLGLARTPAQRARPAAEPAPHPAPAPAPLLEDLAAHAPGAMAREQAAALRQAAPVRTFLARALRVHTDERAWRIGADGEEKVAARLARLAAQDPRWHVLHAIPVGTRGSDIDHLVIGPAGVFALNAKNHPGTSIWVAGNTLLVNGQRQPYLRNSRHEAARAARLLTAACGFPVIVTGVVVPVGADRLTITTPPDDVHVVNRNALARWLRSRPQTLHENAIAAIHACARRPATWQP